ncbi:CDP-glycerol:glycerophosphate glycerophosphotransferase [Jatrophihabitans cynanchi]|uniref:CDP-glycerol:glycerophosphate glycerophosphotransferase n=1 Tax=Jatrophihabitans cynanchi TaxID=2944128 RepID=A0ABY7JU03_9ACTN|nr:glycosyltransferase [Jatrophihabitans sp. SB3-54]WAX56034.1 CDP-glycerol:glycerophosphate glycerophosphotransferase [Jatrophihabitans sp. SB3-54]
MPQEDLPGSPGKRPRLSIIAAVYNVAPYLDEFIASIEGQSFGLDRVEVIAVDDGSTDDSLRVLKDWEQRRPELVRVLTKENGGQGSARNLGLDHARGEWITMPDPDDVLAHDYLAVVDTLIDANEHVAMVGTNRIFFSSSVDQLSDSHPLRRMFAPGDHVVDLARFPAYFHGSAPAAFFRTELIERHNLRFDTRIRPNFEDGHFCSRYLLVADNWLVGFAGNAKYLYRKRVEGTSTLQRGLSDPRRFTDVPRYGYLDLLDRGATCEGGAPEWLQNFILYELSHYFISDLKISSNTAARGAVGQEFVRLLGEIAKRLDPEVINSYRISRFDRVWRDILLHGLKAESWVTPYAVADKRDLHRQLVRVAYRFVGGRPSERVFFRGEQVEDLTGKVRTHEYFGQVLLRERIAWLPYNGTLRLVVNGRPLRLEPTWEPPHVTTLRPRQLDRWFSAQPSETDRSRRLSARDRATLAMSRLVRSRAKYRDAWVLMDRIHDADDNAERLFRHLRDNRREINAWFALERGTPDWTRLVKDGYADRLVAHGNLRWKLLMLNCANLISSHADRPVHRPRAIVRMREPQWRFVFLQHGVIKDDLSRWLNPKAFDLFVTSTPQEQESIAGDDTPYDYTSREAQMTGLPRFDRLREVGARFDETQRDLILVCPTWRDWLNPALAVGSQRREVRDDFVDSDYVRNWLAFLRDDTLRELAQHAGLRVAFMPHPNIQPALPRLDLPPHVEAVPFAGNDVQAVIAQCAVMITDYSSMAFNAAYLDRPVVYFQFDAERALEGGHVGRPGYFSYLRDGFGPVARTATEAVSAVEHTLAAGKRPLPLYQQRIDSTFVARDGRCCERTTAAIEALAPRHSPGPSRLHRLVRTRAARRILTPARLRRIRSALRSGRRVVAGA